MDGLNKQLFSDNISGESEFHNTVSLILREVYETIKDSYGPYGSHIIIDNEMGPEATKDGKSILSSIATSGCISQSVVRMLMNVANKQVEEVGDGSTTTILLLCLLYSRFRNIIKSTGISPSSFQKKLANITEYISEKLRDIATPIATKTEDGHLKIDRNLLYDVVHTAVDADEPLANIITDLLIELDSEDSIVSIKLANGENHTRELVKGIELDGSIVNKKAFLLNNNRRTYENVKIVLVNGQLQIPFDTYMNLANRCTNMKETIVFLATGTTDALDSQIESLSRNEPSAFVNVPIFRIKYTDIQNEFLDIAAILGAKDIQEEDTKGWTTPGMALHDIEKKCGKSVKCMINEITIKFAEPQSDDEAIADRIADIDEKIQALKTGEHDVNDTIGHLMRRKLHMGKHYANLYIGGPSAQRKSINYELADDGVKQGLSSIKHGIVKGCNTVIPKIISDVVTNEMDKFDDIDKDIFSAIQESYLSMHRQLYINKYGNTGEKEFQKMLDANSGIPSPENIRSDATKDSPYIINSAYTDSAILRYSMDMASLLACAKRFISIPQQRVFDIISKQYDDIVFDK